MPRVWAASWYHVGAQGLCCCRQGHADLRGLCCHLGHGGLQTQAADTCRFCIHDPAIAGVRGNVHGPCEHGGGGVVIGTVRYQVSPHPSLALGWLALPLDTAAGKVALPLRGEFVQALEKDDPTPHYRHALTVNLPLAIAVYLPREVH